MIDDRRALLSARVSEALSRVTISSQSSTRLTAIDSSTMSRAA